MAAGGSGADLARRTRARRQAFDAAVAVWVALWIGLGAWVGVEVHRLHQLSTTLNQVGTGISRSADALDALGQLPLVGGTVGAVADQVRGIGQSAQASAGSSGSSVSTLSYLLALAVALIPSGALLGLYVPRRLDEARDARVLAELLGQGAGPELDRLLATRALARLPAEEAWRATTGAGGDRGAAERSLADAELARLGVERPAS